MCGPFAKPSNVCMCDAKWVCSAVRHAPAAYWASWAGSMRAPLQREPPLAKQVLITAPTASAPLSAALESLRVFGASRAVTVLGSTCHSYRSSASWPIPHIPPTSLKTTRASTWQISASRAINMFCDGALRRDLDPASAALLDAQAGFYAAQLFTACPTAPELTLPSFLLGPVAAPPASAVVPGQGSFTLAGGRWNGLRPRLVSAARREPLCRSMSGNTSV